MQELKEGVESRGLSSYKFNNELSALKKRISRIKEEYRLSSFEILTLISEQEVMIPLSVFNRRLSALETISKYLYENVGLEFKEICKLLNRNVKTIWQAYDFARKKERKKFEVKKSKYMFRADILANRKLSVLENIVVFLRENYDLKFSEIASLLARDTKTIWTINKRAERKLANDNQ
jgi:hypothetical protein